MNHRPWIRIAMLAWVASAALAPLCAQRKIGVDEAVALAIANNGGLRRSAISLEAKRRSLGLSWNELLPSVSLGGGLSGSNQSSAADASSLSAEGALSASLSLSASLGESRKLLRLALESELVAYGTARASLELQVRKKVYAILLDGENLSAARQGIEREGQSYGQTEQRYKSGLASELDLLSAKVSLAQLGPKAEGYANALANDIDGLKNLIGIEADEEISAEGALELGEGAIAKLLAAAAAAKTADNRDVAAAAKSLETALSTKTSIERSKLWPSLSLSASVAPTMPLSYSGAASSAKSLTATASAMVDIQLDNLLPGSAARESIAEAQDGVDSGRIAYQTAVKDAEAARRSYARSVESYRSSLSALKLNAELAQQSYDASMKAYKNGLLPLTTLQSAEGDLESAKLGALSKSYDLIAAALDLAYAAGLPLDSIGKE